MKKWSKINRRKKWLIAAILAAVLACFGLESNHVYYKEGALEKEKWQNSGEYFKIQCFDLALNKGTYGIGIGYENEKDSEVSYELVDNAQNDGNNRLGKVLQNGVFSSENAEKIIDFTLLEDTNNLVLNVYTKDADVQMRWWYMDLIEDTYRDTFLLCLIMIAIILIVYNVKDIRKNKYWLIMLGVAVFLSSPFLNRYLNSGHDTIFHLTRIRGMAEAMATGQFPVRLNPAFGVGQGFANSIMYPELFLYVPAIFYRLGVSLIASYKFLILFINIAVALVGYYSFKRLLNSDKLGFICALFYLCNPYRLNNILLRSSIGEALAQIFLPLLMLGMYELVYGDYKKWWLVVIAASGIMQSHILSLEMSLIFVIIFVLINIKKLFQKENVPRILGACKAGICIIGLNIWFLIPFLDHINNNYTLVTEKSIASSNMPHLYQIFIMNFKLRGPEDINGVWRDMPLTIGIIPLVGTIIFAYYAYVEKTITAKLKHIGTVCLALGAFSCYVATNLFPWKFIESIEILNKILGKVQFPWRYLGYASLFWSVTTAIAVVELYKDKKKSIVTLILVFAAYPLFVSLDGYFTDGDMLVENRNQGIACYGYQDYYDAGVNLWKQYEQGNTIATDSGVHIYNYKKQGMDVEFEFDDVTKESVLIMPLYDYGLHKAYINGEETNIQTSDNFQVSLTIPQDVKSGHVEVAYTERKLYKLGNVISVIFLIVWLGLTYLKKRNFVTRKFFRKK